MAGRPVPVHAELRAGRGQQLLAVRAVAVRRRSRSAQHSPQSALDDRGVGVYGQGTFTVRRQARSRRRRARRSRAQGRRPQHVLHAGDRAAAGRQRVEGSSPTSRRSSRWRIARRRPRRCTARSRAASRRAASTPRRRPAREAYDQEHSWNYEGGVKTSALGGRLIGQPRRLPHRLGRPAGQRARTRWCRRSSSSPTPPARRTSGVELELHARPATGVDLFGGVGFTHARFGDGSTSNGVDVSGNKLANAPGHTADFGVQYSRQLRSARR